MQLQPKRRWLRFRVRTLLVAVTIFCVWLSWQVSIVRVLREKSYYFVHTVEDCDQEQWARLQSLFPEAMILTLADFPEDEPIESMPNWERLLGRESASRD